MHLSGKAEKKILALLNKAVKLGKKTASIKPSVFSETQTR